MIPIKLALRNFMPYRQNVPPLYFAGIHTATICGDNGSGKSALIDAITWALWGRARTKSADDLIHSHETEMEVEFEFAVGPQVYRVIRKHAKPKRQGAAGKSSLDLFIASNGSFKTISGNSIQQTQQEIIKALHMDYDTFINSALLLQGRADEFTVANPSERKQVLADILGLSFYDELEEEAKELAKQRETARMQLESAIQEIAAQLAQKPAYEAELSTAFSSLAGIEDEVREQESRLNDLRQKRESLGNKQWQLAQLEEQMKKADTDLQRWEEQVKQHRSRIKEYEEVIAQRAVIDEGYAQLTSAKRLNDELNQKLGLVTRLKERQHQLEMAIVQSSQALLKDHALVENRINELEVSWQKLPQLKSELQAVQAELGQLVATEEVLNQKRQSLQELRNQIHDLESNVARLEQEMAEIAEKLSLLLTQTEAKCPLCEAELGENKLKLIEAKYTTDKQQKFDALKSKQYELAQRKIELGSVESETAELEKRLNQARGSTQNKAGFFSQQIVEAEKAGRQVGEERSKLAVIEEHLAKKDFAITEQGALQQVDGELVKLDYEPLQHDEVRRHLAELEQYETPQRRLEEADRLSNQEREVAARAEQATQDLLSRLEADNQKRQGLASELNSLPQLAEALVQVEAEYQKLRERQKAAQEVVGSIKGRLERCAELERERGEKEKLLSQATKEEKIYRDLAQAFGKKGVQALLIDIALPEIEAEANRLLARMTDNRMHVKVETQRPTKKGDLVETLDINISDELGLRNYEMFSGGEAFRINFAIRIALSKLLARRAGAPLPTLIIDEGFGTQDTTSLEKVKEAITSIQDDFQKILVITHIEEFRDAFPTRIDVIKTAQGSTIEVS